MRLQNVLHKTIVFITHDFDEAIRLADRIAIMQDGEIIQTGTPEQLVLAPATDYVAEFTRGIPRAKVLTARAVMTAPGGGPVKGRIAATARIENLAAQVVDGDGPFAVVDAEDTVIGEISREAVIAVLVERDRRT